MDETGLSRVFAQRERSNEMKIKVTQEDIDKGRENAGKTCRCPIWHSVVRQLNIPESQAEDLVHLPSYETLTIGSTEFDLPPEAVSMQRVLVEYPLATVPELEFFAPVGKYGKKKATTCDGAVCSDQQEEKPGILARLFRG